jgi:hypothetical protein
VCAAQRCAAPRMRCIGCPPGNARAMGLIRFLILQQFGNDPDLSNLIDEWWMAEDRN